LMVFGLRLFKTYDGESLKAQELCEKVHQDGNNHVGAIMGYGDYMIGDSVVFRAYYVEGLGHNLFSVGQFCDSDLEVAFRKHSCFCNRVLERQKKLRNQIFRALTASADVPSSVTETTDTTSTLPPPPPPLQKPTGHRDIWEKVKDQKSRMHH
ncbi:hypothetical protein Tco_1575075, partial [Tanacetum coccineum]